MYPVVYTLARKYLYRDYFEAKVYTIWVHGPLGLDLVMHAACPVRSSLESPRSPKDPKQA